MIRLLDIILSKKRCFYCLVQLENSTTTEVCAICSTILAQQASMHKNFTDHKKIILDFLEKYSYSEVSIEEVYSKCSNYLEMRKQPEITFTNNFYEKLHKHGIIVGGRTYWAIFKPYYQNKVNYTPMRKITGISKANEVDKQFISNYWLQKYHIAIGDDWEYNVKLSFISYKNRRYQEISYDYPSSVFGMFVEVNSETEIEEIYLQQCSICEKNISRYYYCNQCKSKHCYSCREECYDEYFEEEYF